MTETSEPAMLDLLLEAYYGARPHPKTIRLTLAQAQRINYEMNPNGMRLAIERGMDLTVLGAPVEWVGDESESILAIRTLAGKTVPSHIRYEVTTGAVLLTCSAPGCPVLRSTARVWQIDDDGWAIGPFLREHAHTTEVLAADPDAARNAAENLRTVQLAVQNEQNRHADALETLRIDLKAAQLAMREAAPEWTPPREPWDPPIDAWHP